MTMTKPITVVFFDESVLPIVLPEGMCKDCEHYIPNGEPHAGSCSLRDLHVKNENGCEYFSECQLS